MDAEAVWQVLLSRLPAELFHDLALAFELARFCRDGARLRASCLDRLRLHFPNLLKACGERQEPHSSSVQRN